MTEHRLFLDQEVILDGKRWENCTFDGCIVVLNTVAGLYLDGNRFIDCKFVGDGWKDAFQMGDFKLLKTSRSGPKTEFK
jgi:hypothetical protein